MATALTPLFALYPAGYPAAVVAGSVVNLRIFIPGEPVPKGRHRAKVIQPKGGKAFAQFYSDPKTVEFEEMVGRVAKEQALTADVTGTGKDFVLPFEGRLLVTLRFNMHRPASYPASVVHHTKRPDVDNLAKSVLDGLQHGRIIVEDNQVTDLLTSKRYETQDHPQGVEIDITAFG